MPYFIADRDYEIDHLAEIKSDEHHHLAHVQRIKAGEQIELKSRYFSYRASVVSIEKDKTICRITSKNAVSGIRQNPLIAAVPYLKSGNTDLAVQKCTELGIDSFYIVKFERSVPEISNISTKIARWEKIIREASKQCYRETIPEICGIIPSIELFKKTEIAPNRIVLDLVRDNEYVPAYNADGAICYITGPEGGFSETEHELSEEYRWRKCRISKNQLRAETAVIAFASILTNTCSLF